MPFLSSLLSGATSYIAIALACLAAGGYMGYRWELGSYNSLKAANATAAAQAVQKAKDEQQIADAITLKAAVASAEEKQKIIANTGVIVQDVPVYITKRENATHCITIGDVVLLNAAVYQVSPNSIPIASGKSPDSCSDVKASQFIKSIVSNYGKAQQAITEDNDWRNWYNAQSTAWGK
jgi:hypothetical protein